MKKFIDNSFKDQKYALFILIPLSVAIFFLAYFSIKESRADSLKLLVFQGESFIESLSSATKNAISSEEFYTRLAHKRYDEITIELEQKELNQITNDDLYKLSTLHNLYSAHLFDVDSTIVASSFVRGSQVKLPAFVIDEVKYLISNPEENYLLLLDDDNPSREIRHYYIKMSNRMDRVSVIVADARYFTDALEQTQIGYLARQMASENSIEYIIYQSTDGIIFSSLEIDGLLSIESDSFLSQAIEADIIMHRIYTLNETELLEIVRPFSTSDYPFGLLRIGLSLGEYKKITKRFDNQMMIFSTGLLLLLIISVIYLNSRKKRKKILAQYDQIKSISDRIFDEMKTGVSAVDKNGRIILVNKAFESIFQVDNLTDKNWHDTIMQKIPEFPQLSNSHTRLIEKEITFHQDTHTKTLLIVLSYLSLDNDDVDSFVVVVNDISSLKELEQKSARKERLSEMGDLAAGVAHEIRNPLHTISIASQRLAREFIPIENKEEYLSFTKQIKDETQRLNDIITKFLALARGGNKQNAKVNLSLLVAEFIQFITTETKSLKIELLSKIDKECYVNGDADSLKQVFANLYNNAKEVFDKDGGTIKISVFSHNNKSQFIIEDSGKGIPKEIYEKIFTPYYTTKEAGTGLGLPTVHKIVTGMNGEITVTSSELGGAKFVILFS